MKAQPAISSRSSSQRVACPHDWYEGLVLRRWCITVRATKRLRLPEFSGSMIRGALGHALLAAHCRCGATKTHMKGCLYARLFETGAGSAFVITPPEHVGQLEEGELFTWHLSLLADDEGLEKPLLDAVERGLYQGLGPERVSCPVERIEPVALVPTPLTPRTRVILSSPWALKRGGYPVKAPGFRIHDLLIGLAQRQRQLSEHFGLALSPAPNNEILALADSLGVGQSELVDVSGERHSNRQRRRHPLQGIRGQLTLTCTDDDAREVLSQLLNPGPWLHGGGKVGFGMGGMRLEPLAG